MEKKPIILKTAFKVTKPQGFINEKEIKKEILALSPEEARKLRIKHRSTLKRIKDRIIKEGKINWDTKEVKNSSVL